MAVAVALREDQVLAPLAPGRDEVLARYTKLR
jgi:hypothetical protein